MSDRREYVIPHSIVSHGPHAMVEECKAQGFVFDSDVCPIKLAGEFVLTPNADGSVTVEQWGVPKQ